MSTGPWRRFFSTRSSKFGAIAQLGERLNGIQEVTGSIPVSSTLEVAAVLLVPPESFAQPRTWCSLGSGSNRAALAKEGCAVNSGEGPVNDWFPERATDAGMQVAVRERKISAAGSGRSASPEIHRVPGRDIDAEPSGIRRMPALRR
jgi:hypothetical protein